MRSSALCGSACETQAQRRHSRVIHIRHALVVPGNAGQQHACDGGEVPAASLLLCQHGLPAGHQAVNDGHGERAEKLTLRLLPSGKGRVERATRR